LVTKKTLLTNYRITCKLCVIYKILYPTALQKVCIVFVVNLLTCNFTDNYCCRTLCDTIALYSVRQKKSPSSYLKFFIFLQTVENF